jgi:outer membrane protein TolC
MKTFQLLFLVLLLPTFSFAQENVPERFNQDIFFKLVKKNHPIAIQADMRVEMGVAKILEARGGFDPKIQAEVAQKYFKGKEYYDYGEGKLKIPTWFGVELEGGYERNQGEFLNPESSVPSAGLWFAGVSVSVGEGLFIDERRASLRIAQAMMDLNQAEKDLMMNDLLLDAGMAYWNWFSAYYSLQVNIEALQLANQRFIAVKQSATFGDIPTIDTLESGIQVQNRRLNLNQAELEYKNATAFLNTFLWEDGLVPLELPVNTIPDEFEPEKLASENLKINLQLDSSLNAHPEIRANLSKNEQLSIEKRWVREQIKPTLDLKYKPLTEAVGDNPFSEYSINNYTWGVQFEFPIFVRKERAKLNQINLKLQSNTIDLESKRVNLGFKAQAALNVFETTMLQIRLYRQTVTDYGALLEGERELFNGGESSLFMINSREIGFIKAELKMVELVTKNRLAILKIQHAIGQLSNL